MINTTMLQCTESVGDNFKYGECGDNYANLNSDTVYQYSTDEPN